MLVATDNARALERQLIVALKPKHNLMVPRQIDKEVKIVKPFQRYIRKGPGVKL